MMNSNERDSHMPTTGTNKSTNFDNPEEFAFHFPFGPIEEGEGYGVIDVSRGGYVDVPPISPSSTPPRENAWAVTQEPETDKPTLPPSCTSTHTPKRHPHDCPDIETREPTLETPSTSSSAPANLSPQGPHQENVGVDLLRKMAVKPEARVPIANRGKGKKHPRNEPDTSLSPAERKRMRGREDARKARERKKEKMDTLEKRCREYGAIVQIYRKSLSIYHKKLKNSPALWRPRDMTWYPALEGGIQYHNPLQLQCMLPSEDAEFLEELGNNPGGGLILRPSDGTDITERSTNHGRGESSRTVVGSNVRALEPNNTHGTISLPNLPGLESSSSNDGQLPEPSLVTNGIGELFVEQNKNGNEAEISNLTSLESFFAEIEQQAVE